MADKSLGRRLEAAGWDQGMLLPDVPQLGWGVHFYIDEPVTKVARGARNEADAEFKRKNATSASPPLRNGYGVGIAKAKDRWVIASQACDIVSDPNEEPVVVAMRAFTTDNGPTVQSAATNSSRYFLLDLARSLIADGAVMIAIEKPLLARLTPEPGVSDTLTRQRFGRWIGHRFSRPALPDDVVGAVVKPILDHLRELQEHNDPAISVMNRFSEIRIAQLDGSLPYDVRIVFIVPDDFTADDERELARFIALIRTWLDPKAARLDAWNARTLFEISVGDYLATFKLYLDYYTYKGRTIRGLTPLPPI